LVVNGSEREGLRRLIDKRRRELIAGEQEHGHHTQRYSAKPRWSSREPWTPVPVRRG
jgi:hypothetical protein